MYQNAMRQNLARAAACLAVAVLVSTSAAQPAADTSTAHVRLASTGNLPTDGPLFPIVPLVSGVPVTGLSSTAGAQYFFKLDVPPGQAILAFEIQDGSGNADLHLRLGSIPTLSNYDCRPLKPGNIETCIVNSPEPGTWFAMLAAQTAYSGLRLTGTYTQSGGSERYLANGIPVTGISGASGSLRYWRIAPGAGKQMVIQITGGSGDADLYTRFGIRPTTSAFGCRPFLNGNAETCSVTNTDAGDYYIMIRGFTQYSGVILTGSF